MQNDIPDTPMRHDGKQPVYLHNLVKLVRGGENFKPKTSDILGKTLHPGIHIFLWL